MMWLWAATARTNRKLAAFLGTQDIRYDGVAMLVHYIPQLFWIKIIPAA
jgi:hypothetical protein